MFNIIKLTLVLMFVGPTQANLGGNAHQSNTYALERKEILNVVRPMAASKTKKDVLIKVERLNIDKDSAMLIGELRNAQGQELDWSKIEACQADLDKMLWVVLEKKPNWRVVHMKVCASEPPYWYLEDYGGFDKNCGIYKGLQVEKGMTLEQQCQKHR